MKKALIKISIAIFIFVFLQSCRTAPNLTIDWKENILTVKGENLPGGFFEIWYLEAFCKPNSHERQWDETLIDHKTELISASKDGKRIELESKLEDGVVAKHTIIVDAEAVSFNIDIKNPTDTASEAHWAQPCIRLEKFTGLGQEDYTNKSFIFVDNTLNMLPELPQWSKAARYTPGQVWRHPEVAPKDVNPRPLSNLLPSNGLIGCFSKDDSMLLATAWEPWQELFQGVIVCLHSDFRIGGLAAKESKNIKGKIYIMKNDVNELLKRYKDDFDYE